MENRPFVPRNFEAQFQNKETFKFREGKITVVDIRPEILTDEVPVLVAPGWTENFDTYKKGLEMVYKSGRRVISVDYSRRGGIVPKQDSYPQSELRKALQVIQVLRSKHILQTDVIAHSEGAINILMAANFKPWAFRNIVLDRPMGMTGKEEKLDLFKRWKKNRKLEAKIRSSDPSDPTGKSQVWERTKKYFIANPVRAIGEGLRMTNFDALPLLQKLSDEGILITIIAGDEDLMAPAERQIEHFNRSGRILSEDEISRVGGTHNAISIKPEFYMGLALNLLSRLQAKRAGQDSPRVDNTPILN